jgi:hypothetical protein
MNSKLTLKLNKRTIERAKKYAKRKKQSLSVLVEEYFEIISEGENGTDLEISPNVLEMSGIIRLDKNIDWKSEYGKHLDEKYGKT